MAVRNIEYSTVNAIFDTCNGQYTELKFRFDLQIVFFVFLRNIFFFDKTLITTVV